MTRATVIADASLCGETKLAAWGAWIKVDGKPSQVFSGQLRNRMGNSTDAEICALANALAKGVSTALIPPGTEVMLQSDSTQALGLLKKLVPNVTVRQHKDSAELATFRKPQLCGGVRAEAAGVITKLVAEHSLALVLRHVRGHTPGSGRQWVNRLVDAEAKKIMLRARSTVQGMKGEPDENDCDDAADASCASGAGA